MALNLPFRKIPTEPSIPREYSVTVYKDNNYYAKDENGNIICINSPTACIQEAVDSLSGKGGGTVILKSGLYKLSRGITLKEKVSLIGEGIHSTRLVPNDNFTGDYMITFTRESNIWDYAWWRRIMDIFIHGMDRVKHGIYAPDDLRMGALIIERVTIKDMVETGIYQGKGNGVWYIRDVSIYGQGLYGIYMKNTGDSHYENIEVCCYAKGIFAEGLYTSVFIDNRIYTAKERSDVADSGTGMHLKTSYDIRILGDRYNHNDVVGLLISDGSAGISVVGVHTEENGYKCRTNPCYGSGIKVVNGFNVSIIGCEARADYGSTVQIIGGRGNIVEGCVVRSPCRSTDLQPDCRAFDFYDTYDLVVKNCHTLDFRNPPVTKWGFRFDRVYNLVYDGLLSYGYRDSVVYITNSRLRRNSGIATIRASSTRVTVYHSLISNPSKVLITPLSQPPGKLWIENITNTTFDIVTDTAPTNDINIAWYAEV